MVFRKTLKKFCLSHSRNVPPLSRAPQLLLPSSCCKVCLPSEIALLGGGGGGGGTSSPKLCIEARGKVHFGIVIATVVRNFDLISIQRSSRDMI